MSKAPADEKSKAKPDAREARLAKALRENLRRRKAGPSEAPPIPTSDTSAR
jgi:hypothetical protein